MFQFSSYSSLSRRKEIKKARYLTDAYGEYMVAILSKFYESAIYVLIIF